ncbi:MAG: SH3 domain-containing protein [Polyangiaceae bacterium]
MTPSIRHIAVALLPLTLAVAACAPGSYSPDSEDLQGADESTAESDAGLTGSYPVGTVLKSTANVNLRKGPSTNYGIKYTIPKGSTVTVEDSTPQNGFYKIKHNGTTGWSFGAYYDLVSTPQPDDGNNDPPAPSNARTDAINRAKAGVGFSYWWGHGRFLDSGPTTANKGSCSGSCPDCSHSGSYGGDCSGFAAKVWQVPSTNTTMSDDEHPYSTADFVVDSSRWSTVARSDMQQADAMVYRSGGAGHIFIYDSGDAWGSPYAYECKGCSAGCVSGYRSVSAAYHGIRRTGW